MGQPLSMAEVEAMINEVDNDGNGTVEFPEFLTMMMRKEVGFSIEQSVKDAFRSVDPNGSGLIQIEELKAILRGQGEDISDDQLRDIILGNGAYGDDCTDYDAFVTSVLHRV
mmetsp:Transcript_19755/g.59836  ORF Transcript_19755/g.59836 Transcript_19755/m.59836 type:complete len:112 (+) Transcript_19755:357-692(+)